VSLLKNTGTEFKIVEYLKQPLTKKELEALSDKLGLKPKEFIRKRESDFKEQKLGDKLEDSEALFKAMETYPKIMERPIAVKGNRAVIGRPPVNVLSLLE
jgi:arsenate reductase|tara:strand:- start:105 stop:404 length:300 start_codon:yes stop_codon:yes gene_type:complete